MQARTYPRINFWGGIVTTDEVRGLISLLLSNGNITNVRTPSGGYYRLMITAGVQDAAHLQEKADEVRKFLPAQGRVQQCRSGPRGQPGLRFRVTAPQLRLIYNLLYPGRVRRITSSVLELCGARALAWYWCGWLRPGPADCHLLRHVGHTEAEALMVARWMHTILGVESTLVAGPTPPHYPCLRIAPDQVSKGAALLADYCPATRSPWLDALRLDDDRLHEPGALLLPGERQPGPQGGALPPVAGAGASGAGDDLPPPSAAFAQREPQW